MANRYAEYPIDAFDHIWRITMLNIQLMLLSASSTDKVMSGTGIKQDDNGVSV
jgi:hypothetical protein